MVTRETALDLEIAQLKKQIKTTQGEITHLKTILATYKRYLKQNQELKKKQRG